MYMVGEREFATEVDAQEYCALQEIEQLFKGHVGPYASDAAEVVVGSASAFLAILRKHGLVKGS